MDSEEEKEESRPSEGKMWCGTLRELTDASEWQLKSLNAPSVLLPVPQQVYISTVSAASKSLNSSTNTHNTESQRRRQWGKLLKV